MTETTKKARGGGVPRAWGVKNTLEYIIAWLGVIATLFGAYTAKDLADGIECALIGVITLLITFDILGGSHEGNKTSKRGAVHDRTRSGHEKELAENYLAPSDRAPHDRSVG